MPLLIVNIVIIFRKNWQYDLRAAPLMASIVILSIVIFDDIQYLHRLVSVAGRRGYMRARP
jgi:hypothetical protein